MNKTSILSDIKIYLTDSKTEYDVRILEDQLLEVKNITTFIAKYSYPDNLKVSVDGNFPVMQLKKIYLLFKGGQLERYNEYKDGLNSQIESLPERKPQKKKDAIIYLDNFNSIVKSLEKNITN